jgi:hypothetical protein
VSYSPFFTVSIDEVDKKISEVQDIISALPQPIPYACRRAFLASQAILRLRRYDLSKDERDLETSTFQFTHVMFLPFHPSIGCSTNPLRDFFFLTEALYHRSCTLKQPEDVSYCLKYLNYFRDPSFEAFGIPRNKVTSLLVLTLAIQQEFNTFNPISAKQDLEEMSILCRELLASNTSEVDLKNAVTSLAQTFVFYHLESWNQPPNQVMECFREANTRMPDLQEVSIGLSATLSARFLITWSSEDYNDAMGPLDKIISSRFPGDCLSQNVRLSLRMATNLAHTRFILSGDPEYLEEAIVRFRAHLDSLSAEDPERGDIIRSLADLERRRFNDFGVTNGLEEVHSNNPAVIDPPSFLHVAKSLVEANSDMCPSMATSDRFRYLKAFRSVGHITNKADIEEAVAYCRLILPSLQIGPDDAVAVTHLLIIRTGGFLLESFLVIKTPEYLNEAIDVFRGILKVPDAQWTHFFVIGALIPCLTSRFEVSKDKKD